MDAAERLWATCRKDSAHEYRARRYEERLQFITEYVGKKRGTCAANRIYKISAKQGDIKCQHVYSSQIIFFFNTSSLFLRGQ